MYSVNLKLPAKGARLFAVIMALLYCVTALGTGVFAASSAQTVELKANGSEAQLVMDFPQAAAEEIASMQISLVITPSSADIEFVPDSGLSAKIVESRYHSDTGVLTVYLAGTKALFSGISPLTVGKIKISGSNVSAAVKVKEDSIKFVRGSELVTPSGSVAYPGSVTISAGSDPVPPPESPSSSSSTPSSSTSSESSSDPTDPAEPGVDPAEPGIVPVEPADTSSLAETVDRVSGYKRSDYTEESYGTLVEALNRANAVLSNTGSTQDEVDEALLVLENAIGMLVLANNAPSGTDGYGADNSDSSGNSSAVSSENPSDNNSGGEQTPSDSSQTSDTSKTDSSEKEKSGDSTVMWLIIVMAVLAVTAGAIIAVLKLKKK